MWVRATEVAVVDHGSRVVVLDLSDPRTARPLAMDGPAAAIWHALEWPASTSEVVDRVAADFGLPAADVRVDVGSFIDRLASVGLVRTTERRSDANGG